MNRLFYSVLNVKCHFDVTVEQVDRVLRPGGVIAIAIQTFHIKIVGHPRQDNLWDILQKVGHVRFLSFIVRQSKQLRNIDCPT